MEINIRPGSSGRSTWEESDTTLRTYLRDIRKVPLLTREEEIEIAKRIEKSKWVQRQRRRLDALKIKRGKYDKFWLRS